MFPAGGDWSQAHCAAGRRVVGVWLWLALLGTAALSCCCNSVHDPGQARRPPTPGPEAATIVPYLGEGAQVVPDEAWGSTELLPAARLTDGLTVDNLNRVPSAVFFREHYRISEHVAASWSGGYSQCKPGATSAEYREAVVHRINYFRAMAGVPASIVLDATMNAAAQHAALMMAANGKVSHTPDPEWYCYSEEGDRAAGASNLYAGVWGPRAIDGYMEDPGELNYHVPHRRWLLYPRTRVMGTGDVPGRSGFLGANALMVWGPRSLARPQTRDGFVAWPPPGYVPYQVVYPRWSFSYDGADFQRASVAMSRGDEAVLLAVMPLASGYGENTVVWQPELAVGVAPQRDIWYTVLINDVRIEGVTHDFSYTVIVFDPDAPYVP